MIDKIGEEAELQQLEKAGIIHRGYRQIASLTDVLNSIELTVVTVKTCCLLCDRIHQKGSRQICSSDLSQ
jgi:hypothetical protein